MVIGFDPQKQFQELLDVEIDIKDAAKVKNWANFINENDYRNCLIILDEFRVINPSHQPSAGLIELLSMRTERNLDIFVIIHSPSLTTNLLPIYITHYYMFNTQTVSDSFDKKIPNYEILATGLNVINEHCIKNQVYSSINNYGKDFYPYFPYVVYDLKENKLFKINFNKK